MVFKHDGVSVNWSFEARNAFFVKEVPEMCLLLPTEQQEKDVVLPSLFFFRGLITVLLRQGMLSPPPFGFAFIFFLLNFISAFPLSLFL